MSALHIAFFEPADVTEDERRELTGIAKSATSLEMACSMVRSRGIGCWAYQGGKHVAVHRTKPSGMPEQQRIAIITEQNGSEGA